MSTLRSFLADPAVQSLGWALLHFFWQGALMALLLKGILQGIPLRFAHLRYRVASAAMIAMLAMPGLSIWKAGHSPAKIPAVSMPAKPFAEHVVPTVPDNSPPATSPRDLPGSNWRWVAYRGLETLAPWLAVFWIAGVVLYFAKTLGGLIRAQLLKRGASVLAGDEWACKFISVALCRSQGGSVRLLESDRIGVPTVIGWLKPVVLMPAGAAAEFAPEQLDALLAHEFAHIRRRDYLVNLLQTSIEILLWYHPAIWWVALQVRAERECCCDDEAVAVCGDALTYARALTRAERLRSALKLAVALSSAPLLNRIRRLTEMKTPQLSRVAVCLIGVFAVSLILAAGAGSSLLAHMPVPFDQKSAGSSEPTAPLTTSQPPAPIQIRAVSDGKSGFTNRPVRRSQANRYSVIPSESEPPGLNSGNPSTLQQMVARLKALRMELDEKATRYKPSHPDLLRLNHAIAYLEQQLFVARRQEQPQETPGLKITGFVHDPAGALIPGVAISIIDPEQKEVLARAQSDAQGRFEIEIVPDRDFELRFEHSAFIPQVYARKNLGSGPLRVTMELGPIKETVIIITGADTAPAAAQARKPIWVGGNFVQPKLIQKADPVYPPAARQENLEGTVVVSALIDEEGSVKDPIVLSGHRMLNAAALEAVQQWRYSPALLNGEPWPMRLSITLVFKLVR